MYSRENGDGGQVSAYIRFFPVKPFTKMLQSVSKGFFMPNIREVAKAAGFSTATISRVINHPNSVSAETRERIYEVMRELNYTPNTHARGLALDKSNSIALLLPDFLNQSYLKIAKGIEEIAHKRGYFVFLCNSENNLNKESRYLDLLIKGRRVDGLILVNTILDDRQLRLLQKENIPLVITGRRRAVSNINSVCVDYVRGGYQAGKHLISLGYRSFGFISNRSVAAEDEKKFQGFKQALDESGIKIDGNNVIDVPKTISGGTLAAQRFFESENCPEAIFATSDPAAIAALKYFNDNNLKVPDDVAVIGFDDIEMTELASPRLTTVSVPSYKLGLLSARLLFDEIDDHGNESQEIFLQTKLNIRESCGHGPTSY